LSYGACIRDGIIRTERPRVKAILYGN